MTLPALPELFFRLFMALLLGAIVGIEREYQSKNAGFRTMMLLSLGACLITMLSIAIGGPDNGDRIAANIATGVGFLGAGVIFRDGAGVSGITTAASIWAVAALGMAAGAGHYWLGSGAAFAVLIVLTLLPAMQRWIDVFHQIRHYTITVSREDENFDYIRQRLTESDLRCKRLSISRGKDNIVMLWQAIGSEASHERFTQAMIRDPALLAFEG
jgi:putative Mg2+ transporter-C (MgtC) family protein